MNRIILILLLAGAVLGFQDTLDHHYHLFKKVFPKANDQWFNNDISWTNKYKNHDVQQGPKFFLSTSVFVAFTDQYHLNKLVYLLLLVFAIVISRGFNSLDFIIFFAFHQLGFTLIFHTLFK